MAHELIVDMVLGEITGQSGKQVDVGLADRLGEFDGIADLCMASRSLGDPVGR